jgi:NADP-dependent 3-hydroxy acid dehydrogenase YdfG
MTDLTGRVFAITGASSGIGEATALAAAEAGAKVALGARRKDRLQALAERIGDAAWAFEVDVADQKQSQAFVDGAREHFGRVDVLVANAGVMLLGPFEHQDPEDWSRMIDANVYGVLYTTRAALPIMREQGGGDVVIVSSVAGRRAGANAAVYNVTKFGVTAFAEALRQETADSDIRVCVVEPGWVETELLSHNADYVQSAAAERKKKMGQPLLSEDIAAGILYAVSQPSRVGVNELLIRPSRQRD